MPTCGITLLVRCRIARSEQLRRPTLLQGLQRWYSRRAKRHGGDSGDRMNADGAHRLHLLVLAVLPVLDDRRRRRRGCWSVLWQLGQPCLHSFKSRKVGMLSKGRWQIAPADISTIPEPREVLHHIVRKAWRHRQLYCT